MKRTFKKALLFLCLTLALCLLCACKGDTPPAEGGGEHTHAFGEWKEETAATCTAKGVQKRVCACGESETQETGFAHKWSAWTVTTPAKCNAAGEKMRTCPRCSGTETSTVLATGEHAYNVNNVCADCDHALQYTATGIHYGDNSDGTCCVSSVDTNITQDVVIPYYHDGKKVTKIAADAFNGNTTLKNISVPDSVTAINGRAFQNCTKLTAVRIGTGSQLTSIGSSAFYGCSHLTSINLPASVTSIGYNVFYGCSKLIQMEGGVSYVDKWVVDCDTSITAVTLRPNTVGIGSYAFYECTSLASISIPASVIGIGDFAFCNCTNLTTISIPASVTSIGNASFYCCTNLTTITFGENSQLQSIGDSAFRDCSNLTTATCDATGWWVSTASTATSGTPAELTADNLKSTYSAYYWKRG